MGLVVGEENEVSLTDDVLQAAKDGRWADVRAAYSSDARRYGQSAHVYRIYADVFTHYGMLEDALACLKSGIDRKPQAVFLRRRLGTLLHHKLRRFAEALAAYRAFLALKPENIVVQLDIVHCYLQMGDLCNAQLTLDQLTETQQGNSRFHRLQGEIVELEKGLMAALPHFVHAYHTDTTRDKSPAQLARMYAASGRLDEAHALFRQALEAATTSDYLQSDYARFLWRTCHDVGKALELLDGVLATTPESYAALCAKAEIYQHERRSQEAESLYQVAVLSRPDNLAASLGLVTVKMSTRRFEEALSDVEALLVRSSHNRSALRRKGELLIALGRLSNARTYCDDLVMRGFTEEGQEVSCRLAEAQGNWKAALEAVETLLVAHPRSPWGLRHRAHLLIMLERYEEAKEYTSSRQSMLADGNLLCVRLHLHHREFESALQRSREAFLTQLDYPSFQFYLHCVVQFGTSSAVETALDEFRLRRWPFMQNPIVSQIFGLQHALLSDWLANWPQYEAMLLAMVKLNEQGGTKARSAAWFSCYGQLSLLSVVRQAIARGLTGPVEEVRDFVAENPFVLASRGGVLALIEAWLGEAAAARQEWHVACEHYRLAVTMNPDHPAYYGRLRALRRSQAGQVCNEAVSRAPFLMLVIGCEKFRDKLDLLRNHVYSGLGVAYLFVIGRPEQLLPWRIVEDVLYVKSADTYEGLSAKVTQAMSFVAHCTSARFVFKVDDDVIVCNEQRFIGFVNWLLSECEFDYLGSVAGRGGIDRAWHYGKCQKATLNHEPFDLAMRNVYAAGGAPGYVLSRRACEHLVEHVTRYPGTIREVYVFEDVLVGSVLAEYGITPQPYDFNALGVFDLNSDPRTYWQTAEHCVEKAQDAMRANQLPEAVSLIERAIKAEPDQPLSLYRSLQRLYRGLRNNEAADVLRWQVQLRYPDQEADGV
jgi:tetratricopeptide (TPR) repeat protein